MLKIFLEKNIYVKSHISFQYWLDLLELTFLAFINRSIQNPDILLSNGKMCPDFKAFSLFFSCLVELYLRMGEARILQLWPLSCMYRIYEFTTHNYIYIHLVGIYLAN